MNNKTNFTPDEQELIDRKPDLKRPKSPQQQATGDRVAQSTAQAAASTDRDKTALANAAANQLAGMKASLDSIAANRNRAIEQVSDSLAYLWSPETFQADVMRRTAEKLSGGENLANPLDTLANTFGSFADGVQYPAIAPATDYGAISVY
jgi:hypothetical protein